MYRIMDKEVSYDYVTHFLSTFRVDFLTEDTESRATFDDSDLFCTQGPDGQWTSQTCT